MTYELSNEIQETLLIFESAGFDTTDIRSEINDLITEYEDFCSEKNHELEETSILLKATEELLEGAKSELKEKDAKFKAHAEFWMDMRDTDEAVEKKHTKKKMVITSLLSAAAGFGLGLLAKKYL